MAKVETPANEFIGRDPEVSFLAGAIADKARIITLWGTAGIGKTRLAREFAAHHLPEGHDAVFCDLSMSRDLDTAQLAIADALGLRLPENGSSEEIGESLGFAIAARGRVLLVLDNLEQIVDDIAPSITAWCERATLARFLVTTRERLRVPGEHTLEVSPLSVLPDKSLPAGSAAAQLFLERTAALVPDFKAGDKERATIAELVERLEGIPLAIELAAARMDLLGLDQLRTLLSERLATLNAKSRGVPSRQSTLRAAIAWSWDLLSNQEQTHLAQSSVFCGSFDLDAACQVLQSSDASDSTIDVLQSLRDKSLLLVHRDKKARFHMYASVRAYAAEKLAESQSEQAVYERHGAYYLKIAEEHAESVQQSGAVESLLVLSEALENLLAVFERSVGNTVSAEGDIALRVVLALDVVLATRGTVHRHQRLLERALARAVGETADPHRIASGKRALGNVLRLRGDLAQASELLTEALATLPSTDRANVLADIGVLHHQRRELAEASDFYRQAEAAARAEDKQRVVARVLGNLGALHHDAAEFEKGAAQYQAALRIFREIGDTRLWGIFLTNLGVLELEQGNVAEARSRFERARGALEEVSDQRLMAITLGNMGLLEHLDGDVDLARSYHDEALPLLRAAGDTRSEVFATIRLAAALASSGQAHQAAQHFDQAAHLLETVDDDLGAETLTLARSFTRVAEAHHAWLGNRAISLDDVHAAIAIARDGSPSLVNRSDDARLLVRRLEHEIAVLTKGCKTDMGAFVVGPEAKWFRCPESEWQDISSRRELRLILLRLVRERRAQPGHALTLEELRLAAWPDDLSSQDAASNRTYVLLTKLRKLGLQKLLLREDGGYVLDPGVHMQRVASHWRICQRAEE